jgi:50S ribosomal protein L16 3-hydroxylase
MEDFPLILGGISAKQFLTEYWQKKPLFIKGAIPNFLSPITGDELAGLSLEQDVESRLIFGEKGYASWVLKRGPFHEETFKKLPKKYWTLLVQAVDLWSPEVKELIEHFYFLPKWRLEDIMISFSPEGGSVGPHFDNYDVFLLQGIGQREWQIGQPCNAETETFSDCSLSIIKEFQKGSRVPT